MINRRSFLRNASLASAAGILAANSSVLTANTLTVNNVHKSFGLQIYSLGGELAADVDGGLKKLSQMGYSHLELAGYNTAGRVGAVPIADFKKMADDAGLKITSSHVGQPTNEYTRENFDRHKEHWKIAADHHASIGCQYIIQPGQPRTRNTEEVDFVGEVYNELGRIAKAAGLKFGFHNHEGEFRRVSPGGSEMLPLQRRAPEGTSMIYDRLIEKTDPSLVDFQLDVYWAVMGQQDPVAYMRRYPNRIRLLHIKDVAVLGESGLMNFQKIFETAYANGIELFHVELERYRDGTQFEGVKACADYLLNAPFVK